MRRILTLLVVLSLAACQVQSPSAPSPVEQPQNRPAPGATIKVIAHEAKVSLPAGFALQHMEFGDASHGYALMHKCSNTACDARFFATEDTGKSWTERPFKLFATKDIQFYVADAKTVLIWQDKHPSLLSADGGRTWREIPEVTEGYPAEFETALQGRYGNFQEKPYDFQARKQIVGPKPGGTLTAVRDVNGADGIGLWLTYMEKSAPATYQSLDGGKTWKQQTVLKQPGRELFHARVLQSGFNRYDEQWLVAEQEPLHNGGGKSLLRSSVLKATGMPLIWKFDHARGWVPVLPRGLQEEPTGVYSVAPAGSGGLFVAKEGTNGREFGWLDGQGYVKLGGLPVGHVGQLRDGTAVAGDWPHVYVASVPQDTLERTWIRVRLSPQTS